jgi:hypothetical protein
MEVLESPSELSCGGLESEVMVEYRDSLREIENGYLLSRLLGGGGEI